MYQFQVNYRNKYRQFYVQSEIKGYSGVVEQIISNINTLFGVVFQIQYLNDENTWITLSENDEDIKDLFRCLKIVPFADFRRIKVKIVEGCSPAPTPTSDSTKSWQRTTGVSPPPAKHPKHLSFEHVEDDSYAGITDYKSPIELDIDRKKSQISCTEEQLEYYDTEYDKLVSRYTISRSTKQEKQCGKCHLFQGHRKNNYSNDCCVSAIMCGDVSKHLEKNTELRDLVEKKQKLSTELRKERSEFELKMKCSDKINSSFGKRMESHLISSNRNRYLVQTAFGIKPRQALLNEHVSILERHYKGIFPSDIEFEKSRFASIIERGYAPLPRRPENSVHDLLTTNPGYGVNFPSQAQGPTSTFPNPEPTLPPPPPPPPPLPPLPANEAASSPPYDWYYYQYQHKDAKE